MNHHIPSYPATGFSERLRAAAMHLLPHHLLGALMRRATRVRLPAWKNWQIRWFIGRYGVDLGIAHISDPLAFRTFNEFFTRALREGVRPVCRGADELACPADGMLSEFGTIEHDTMLQAKGQCYSLTRLLGGDTVRAEAFDGGNYATVYLSPRDYHRVHMPLSGTLREMVHVPGRLFSVNLSSARSVPGLFVRNERVVSIFETAFGPMALVLVGAVFVGSIEQAWVGEVTPARGTRPRVTHYPSSGQGCVHLGKGVEMGRFNMGSTVILVLPQGPLRWNERLVREGPLRMGEALARLGPPRHP